MSHVPYDKGSGLRPCRAQTLEDQLGLVPGTKSKIEDGSAMGTSLTLGAAVADAIFGNGYGVLHLRLGNPRDKNFTS